MQYCLDEDIPIARFFFFRSDPTRNTVNPVVATIVDQLIRAIPGLHPIIIPIIQEDPLIFTKSLETQFRLLVFAPLLELDNLSVAIRPPVLLFDGVDECNDYNNQISLIRVVSHFISGRAYPVIVFFASRAEPLLNAAFREPYTSKILREITLDNNYSADNCIRLFLDRSFAHIKNTHHLRHTLNPEWPSREDVEIIVSKSSRQFIFAAVSIKFISTPDENPAAQLKIILGLRPVETSNPFAQLDALYVHIFSNVKRKNMTSLVLAWGHVLCNGRFGDLPVRIHARHGRRGYTCCTSTTDIGHQLCTRQDPVSSCFSSGFFV